MRDGQADLNADRVAPSCRILGSCDGGLRRGVAVAKSHVEQVAARQGLLVSSRSFVPWEQLAGALTTERLGPREIVAPSPGLDAGFPRARHPVPVRRAAEPTP